MAPHCAAELAGEALAPYVSQSSGATQTLVLIIDQFEEQPVWRAAVGSGIARSFPRFRDARLAFGPFLAAIFRDSWH